ncbi:MAG: FAD-dependent oxidoreductase [Calditrichaeota bacterium]|nr:FAD-dependent oxidoreductase [Calditrichota bacterium]MCB9391346.1 FAD-dependent oxidoreductase [Calditrichota bacterium]
MHDTLILGAGPAGLAAGYYLTQAGHRVTLLEAASEPGGYGRTLAHGPFRYDTGAHRFHDKDAEITRDVLALMGEELLRVHAPSQISWNGKFLDFPLSPVDVARKLGPLRMASAGVDLLGARLRTREDGATSFADSSYRKYGKTIADAFLIGYSEKLWGVSADRLAPEVSGGRLKGLRARTMLFELLRSKRDTTEHLDGSFYYPRQGYGRIAERLAEEIGRANVRVNTRITALKHDTARITQVVLESGESLTPERIVNTLSPSVTLKLLDPAPPQELLELSRKLKFRDLMLVAILLDRPHVTRNASIYFPSPDVPFTRLYEPKNRSAELAPAKQTCVVIEIPCFASDKIWNRNDEKVSSDTVKQLAETRLIDAKDVIECRVHRLHTAYPILELGTAETVAELNEYLNRFVNLYTVGRAGRFEYTHVHDLLRQGKDLAKLLRAETSEARVFDSV